MSRGTNQMVQPFLLNDKKAVCWQLCMLRDLTLTNTHLSFLHRSSSKAAQGWRLHGRRSNDVWTESIYLTCSNTINGGASISHLRSTCVVLMWRERFETKFSTELTTLCLQAGPDWPPPTLERWSSVEKGKWDFQHLQPVSTWWCELCLPSHAIIHTHIHQVKVQSIARPREREKVELSGASTADSPCREVL